MRTIWILPLIATLALAGCNGTPEENATETNMMNVPDEVPLNSIPANEAELPTNNAAENRAEPPEISEEQQIQDDAAATGMTSRLPEESATPSPSPTPEASGAASN